MSLLGALWGIVGLLTSALTQSETNGASLLGTLTAPLLPNFLTTNPLISGYPWGTLTAAGSNPYTSAPNTGVVRRYDFTISRGSLAPDGYQKNVLMINGAFPAPTIEANWGDTIQVTVHNSITGPEEGTSLHWHGILQKENPWYDGVPGVQQCPIAPGTSFTYSFRADLYGTSWYHSHYSAQYAGGLFGAMIIYGPATVNYDIDLGPVILSDHYHKDYFTILASVVGNGSNANPAPLSDNNLINGKNNFDCSTVAAGDKTKCTNNAGISQFKFTTGKTHRLRLINAGAEGLQHFSIDGHSMQVIANDFVPVQPYTTKVVTLGIGQRTDVLVTANAGASNSAWWMRSTISVACSLSLQPHALAAIYYDQAPTSNAPTSTSSTNLDLTTCGNDPLAETVPVYSLTPTTTPATTREFDVNFGFNSTGHFLWTLDGTSFRANYNAPVLLLANNNQSYQYDALWNVKNFGSNSSIRVVVNNKTPVAHPMHLHGHNMYLLHEGLGAWDGTSITNPTNPQRRDVQMLQPGGHMVWQIDADNPGVWPFHCHIAWHVSAGLYANILERPADIPSLLIPNVLAQTCTSWAAWSKTEVVDQIDSGL